MSHKPIVPSHYKRRTRGTDTRSYEPLSISLSPVFQYARKCTVACYWFSSIILILFFDGDRFESLHYELYSSDYYVYLSKYCKFTIDFFYSLKVVRLAIRKGNSERWLVYCIMYSIVSCDLQLKMYTDHWLENLESNAFNLKLFNYILEIFHFNLIFCVVGNIESIYKRLFSCMNYMHKLIIVKKKFCTEKSYKKMTLTISVI